MFCIGHSHVRCVEEAAQEQGVALNCLNLWTFGRPVLYDGPSPRLDPDLKARLGAPIFSLIGGSAHEILGLIKHPRAFDIILPEAPDLPLEPGAEILPAAAVRQTMESLMSVHLDLLRLLPGGSAGPVFHLESPPPFPDDDVLTEGLAGLMATPFFERFVPAGETPAPSEPSRYQAGGKGLRYKLWRLNSQIVRETCAQSGVIFVPRPPQSVDAEGYLKRELFAFAGHANKDYGAMLLNQMAALGG
jgi:hypothetical protein